MAREIIVCFAFNMGLITGSSEQSIMRNNNMPNATRYPFSDLTQPEVEAIIARARTERSQAIRNFFYSLFRTHTKQQGSLAEFATRPLARVSPC
jgi:hypothetical protein